MKVIEPGHVYELTALDGDDPVLIRFVNREDNPHSGTQTQEVLRAQIDSLEVLVDRTNHCDACLPWPGNERIIKALSEAQRQLRLALLYHEERAFERKIDKEGLKPEHVSTGSDGHYALMENSHRRAWCCPVCYRWLTGMSINEGELHVATCWRAKHFPRSISKPGLAPAPAPAQSTGVDIMGVVANGQFSCLCGYTTDESKVLEILAHLKTHSHGILMSDSKWKCEAPGCGEVYGTDDLNGIQAHLHQHLCQAEGLPGVKTTPDEIEDMMKEEHGLTN